MDIKLPRILSPNLGCPIIVSPADLMQDGIDVVIAEPIEAARSDYGIVAKPSRRRDGPEFDLVLKARHELTDPGLPRVFDRVEQTRFLISTTLRTSIFAGKARFVRFSARPGVSLSEAQLRTIDGHPRTTLYDLVLRKGDEEIFTVFHALALRPPEGTLRFIHATDLHVALRNDAYHETLKFNEQDVAAPFINFNDNLRRFIRHANVLADQGKLDFVLMLGDLVDFEKHNYSDQDDYGENNWRLLGQILTGHEAVEENPGIKVPVFTSTGNHDWRFFPYPPVHTHASYGLDKKSVKALDPFWADDPEELVKATKKFYQKMIGEGALLSNVMLGGKYLHTIGSWLPKLRNKLRGLLPSRKVRGNLLDWTLPRMATWQVQVLAPLTASVVAAVGAGGELSLSLLSKALALVSGAINGLIGLAKFLVRWRFPDLMALEAGWEGLREYFLNLNPYFNYAFRVNNNYFLILDTGFDCLRAQRFWDDGRKKLGPLSIRDNLLGGSPDSMGFFDANEFYPFSQIAWMECLLHLIHHSKGNGDSPARIFVGVHAPPVNLSKQQRLDADLELELLQAHGRLSGHEDVPEMPLEPGKYDVRYGSINHYLSQFLHLCLGRTERSPDDDRLPHVTMALAGHAHWKLECSLRWTDGEYPGIYYGDYTSDPKAMQAYLKKSRPLILQTPAVGPVGGDIFSQKPPHFRWIEIDGSGAVLDARVTSI